MASPQTDPRTAQRLRRGQIPVEGFLDLHGLRQDEAQEQLFGFLQQSAASGRRCVLVITGKGSRGVSAGSESGVLRRMLPVWLGMAPVAGLVLEHSSAKPQDGGEGAFYILLRRVR
jgi:DNA-nicking Smr family endonuclease